MTGVAELIRHIKANPNDLDAAALALRYQVDRSVVAAAMAKVAPASKQDQTGSGKSFRERVSDLWLRLTSKPVWFLIATSVFAFVVLRGVALLPADWIKAWPKHFGPRLYGGVMMGTPFLQFMGVARFGKYRYILMGSAIYLLSTIVLLLLGMASKPEFGMVVVSITALSILYLIVGAPFIVFGAYRRVHREKRAYESMTRQQLLERLLWVRQALATSKENQGRTTSKVDAFLAKAERVAPYVAAFVAFALSSGMSLALTAVDPSRSIFDVKPGQGMENIKSQSSVLVATMLASLVIYFSEFLLGLAHKSGRRLLVSILAFSVGYVGAALMPFAYVRFGDNGRFGWGNYVFGVALQGIMIVIGYLGRSVYEHTVAAERRRNNDPAALTDELVELEWRLVPTSSQVTVLAVDVVGSTSMKRTADPLVAEWSFREYQAWVERVSAGYGGKVHSTAGDGAILGFESPEQALQASLALTHQIGEFNATKNRLADPFGIRIGLHSGEVQGDLGAVQFTRVIDIAAHIEGKAPVGGIAASEVVLAQLDASLFQKAAATTDGHDVYIYVGPREP